MYVSDFLIGGALLALVLFFCDWARRVRRRAAANFRALAGQHGLKISTNLPGRGPYAEGRLGARIFRFSEFKETNQGQSVDLLWFELEMPDSRGFSFHLQEKNAGLALVRELGEADVTLGDPEFEQRWHAETNAPDQFRRTFTPQVRLVVDAATAASRWGEIRLLDGWLSYREQSDLDGPHIGARFDGLRQMLGELAAAVEAADGKGG